MDTYTEFCIRFWEATRELDLYSMDGSQLDRLIVDALLKTNGGKELLKTSMNELSVLIKALNHNNKKIQQPSLPSDLDEAAREIVIKMHPCLKDCTILGDRLTRGQLMALVKAGAEWMAGQGYTVDGIHCTNPQMDCINCPRRTAGGFNIASGTSTATLQDNTSATDGKEHNPSFTD